ncbi:hypothetical protein [Blastomonas aquatica]|uniref:Uncharacterized protein n=1 Tax=Blastomonas aquatica TaxID=1510276 RepID=A0ABQ1JHU0_9SPHN|nr:hypothetical protein [Blastomonas aquatica]GGB68900.1 hypothetical protein GCM10010833_25150 [Blastomonas aquatica]
MALFTELVQRFFPNNAISLLLKALDWCDDLFRDQIVWPDLRTIIRPTLMTTSSKRNKIVKDEYSAARLVLSIVASVAEREVGSGRIHVYRGILDRDGESLRFIAEEAFRQLQDCGWMDHDEWQDRIEQIDERVRDAG